MPFGEAAEELFQRIDRAPWFGRLGMAVTHGDVVAVVERADFQKYANYAAARALGIPVKNKTSIPDLVPVASNQSDPTPELSAALSRLESEPRVFEPLKHVRIAVHRRVHRIEPDVPRSAWLCFGELDLRADAVRTAAEAARWAVTEQYLHRPGFWTRVFELFLEGNYPYGTADDGRLYVL